MLIRAAVAGLAAVLACLPAAGAATLPNGFTESLVASGLSNATAMQFAPDGRLFVCQQGGALRVVKNGTLLPTPFVTLSVSASGERGLLGVAFDPNFSSNQYVYVYYTTSGAPIHNRVSRFTANGDVAVTGSEVVIVDLDNLSTATNHNGGAIDFGADGRLYVAVGDNANSANAQSLTTRHGKMLRLNADGSIPADNPSTFPGIGGSTAGVNKAIWAVGLRNPFTFALNPGGTPPLLINDVGEGSWEEVNAGGAGLNYGWPGTEGDFNPASNPAYTRPRFTYSSAVNPACAITGGAVYLPPSATFPAEYIGTYFFADYCAGWIRRIDPTEVLPYPGLTAPIDFASGIISPVDLKVGADGSLYYLARGSGSVYRVQYGNGSPAITSHPANATVSAGQSATFTVGASGAPPLAYQWQRNNVDIPGATASSYTFPNAQPANDGNTFRVNVSNAVGNVFSNAAILTVTANQPPVATITAPAAGTRYTGGITVAFAGTGADPEDGTLPASAFTWQVDFHHDTHTHPVLQPTSGMTSGTFDIPATGETSANVWYRISLTVRDSAGRTTTVQRDVLPQTVQLTLATTPAGLQLRLDGQPVTAPAVVAAVVGMQRALEAFDQAASGRSYGFAAWSDGGATTHTIVTPAVDTTYTATYRPLGAAGTPGGPPSMPPVVDGVAVVGGVTPGFMGACRAGLPGRLALDTAGGVATFAWPPAPGATSYRLQAGTVRGGSDIADLDLGPATSLPVALAQIPAGTYYVRIAAVNACGRGAPSNEVVLTVR